jgi:hypothetical protein
MVEDKGLFARVVINISFTSTLREGGGSTEGEFESDVLFGMFGVSIELV